MRTNVKNPSAVSETAQNSRDYRKRFSKSRGRRERPDWVTVTEITLSENDGKDGLELRFPGKPSESILATLNATKQGPRVNEWNWSGYSGCWYAKRNDINRAFAAKLIADSKVDIYAGYQIK